MTISGQVLGVTSVLVDAPLSGLDLRSRPKVTVVLDQEFNTHDVARITLPDLTVPTTGQSLGYGAPIILQWSGSGAQDTFIGYVHDTQPYDNSNTRGTVITAVSAGFVLKTKRQRLFRDMTAPAIAQQIAQESGLAFDVEPHARVFHQISQNGKSDWEILVDLAKRVGYSVRVEGVTLQFVSRERLARYYRSLAPAVQTTSLDSMGPGVSRDILEFTPMMSEHQQTLGESLATHVVSAVDNFGNVISQSVSGVEAPGRAQARPAYSTFHTMEPARSATEAQQIAHGIAESNRYPIRAHALMWGDPSLQPNRVLQITGLGNGLSGYWTVLQTRHGIQSGQNYKMEVILGAEGLGDENFTAVTGTSGTSLPLTGLLKAPYAAARLTLGEAGAAVARGIAVFDGGPRWAPI